MQLASVALDNDAQEKDVLVWNDNQVWMFSIVLEYSTFFKFFTGTELERMGSNMGAENSTMDHGAHLASSSEYDPFQRGKMEEEDDD